MARRALAAMPAVAAALLAVTTLAPCSAVAADEIGLFFDRQGVEPCAEASVGTTLNLYLLLLSPSAGDAVAGWECCLELTETEVLRCTLAGTGAMNVASTDLLQFQVGIGVNPLASGRVVELARFSIVTLGAPCRFSIYPFSPPSIPDATTPVYAAGYDGSRLVPMTPRGLSGGALVAGVGLPECIKEEASWGRVKRVYEP